MANELQDGDTFLSSKEPALNGYGQNGYQGPSSDLPGQHTSSNFLPEMRPDPDVVVTKSNNLQNWQTRDVKAEGYPPAHGHKPRAYYDIGAPKRAVKTAGPGPATKGIRGKA